MPTLGEESFFSPSSIHFKERHKCFSVQFFFHVEKEAKIFSTHILHLEHKKYSWLCIVSG